MTRYFLSYSRADEVVTLRLADDLLAAGVPLWVDQYDIRPSQHWDRAVEDAVRESAGMIVVLSPHSAASPNVADEVSVAIELKKAVIPLMITPCTVPLRMTRMQYIDATTDYDRALRKCLAEIARYNEPVATTAPAAAVAEPVAPLDAAVVELARRRLTARMGPIAGMLVKAAAGSARSKAELYQALATKLPTDAERSAFLADVQEPAPTAARAAEVAPVAAPAAWQPERIAAITAALTRSLGPIAPRLVAREQRVAGSTADLCRKLALLIPTDRERAAFVRAVETG
ncbi:toll/interleukin-1 receptor domain-containing protein [Sphingosinicellaceae bacterium]|nr:toll/interleukin-1 receptor domain-containing protein [Sphingosinicellaceae bacterium]